MTVPRWRIAIVAGALIVLSAVGGGLAQAAPVPVATTSSGTAPLPPFAGEHLMAPRDRFGDRGIGRLRKHLVHGIVTVLDRDGKLITLQLDHGTIAAIGTNSITIAEAGDSSVTVATTAETRVRKNRQRASLAKLAVGDEVVVTSVVAAGAATARLIVVPPPAPVPAATGGGS